VDDRIWGVVLIAIGVAMIALHPWSERIDGWLKGMPDHTMTAILVLFAIIIICIAFGARPAIKALLILWIVMP
jgi:predicted MFS family arabinose efflux permease